jgi:hypothetical protein
MTANMTRLTDDARAAGFTVATDPAGHTTIIKLLGKWKKQHGIIVYADGTAFVVDVPLSVAKGIRDYATMRLILDI